MKFVDEVKVRIRGGNGGPGKVNWRREAHVPKGGPDGGDGGDGGAVIFVAKKNLNTLIDLAMRPDQKAKNGETGAENNKTGADGDSLYVNIPAGTQVYYKDELVADLSQDECMWVAARGGKGGKGNSFFKNSHNQAPTHAQPGVKGEYREFTLVLKSIADVGLVGFPNVGKSTLLKSISRSHAKVADYPFTTLEPNLGVVTMGDDAKFVVADVPGLIRGASEGKGLGIEFLKHLERTKLLVLVIDLNIDQHGYKIEDRKYSDEEIVELYTKQKEGILNELKNYSEKLFENVKAIAISKCDLDINKTAGELIKEDYKDYSLVPISSHYETGLDEIKEAMAKRLFTDIPKQEANT